MWLKICHRAERNKRQRFQFVWSSANVKGNCIFWRWLSNFTIKREFGRFYIKPHPADGSHQHIETVYELRQTLLSNLILIPCKFSRTSSVESWKWFQYAHEKEEDRRKKSISKVFFTPERKTKISKWDICGCSFKVSIKLPTTMGGREGQNGAAA